MYVKFMSAWSRACWGLMHNASEIQTLNSVSSHEDAKDRVGTYAFMDSEWVLSHVHRLASVTARLCIVRSVMVVIQCWINLLIQTEVRFAFSLSYFISNSDFPCVPVPLHLFLFSSVLFGNKVIWSVIALKYHISSCHIYPAAKLKVLFKELSISITVLCYALWHPQIALNRDTRSH